MQVPLQGCSPEGATCVGEVHKPLNTWRVQNSDDCDITANQLERSVPDYAHSSS